MSYLRFALRADRPDDALALARAFGPDGQPAGWLAAWAKETKPEGAMRIDARAVDHHGPAGWLSLVLAPASGAWLFDDPAVVQALRNCLLLPPTDVLSTLLSGVTRFGGALTALYERDMVRLESDPFAQIYPGRRILRVEAGFLGRTPTPVGPVIQRYGAGQPWPLDRFP